MRDRLILAVIVVLLLAASAAVANGLYFEPMRLADAQIRTLASELADLQTRERLLRDETSQVMSADLGPDLTSLADTAPSGASSAERLQELVRNAVAEFGGQPISTQSGFSELGSGLVKTSLLMRARFDEAGLLSFLRRLEGMTPVVLVEVLEIQPLPVQVETRSLDVTANLVGFHANAAAS